MPGIAIWSEAPTQPHMSSLGNLLAIQDAWTKEGFGVAEHHNQTVLQPIGLLALAVLSVAVVLVPRRWAPAVLIALACTVPSAPRVVIATLDFSFLRLLVLFGCLRAFVRGEHRSVRPLLVDKLTLAWSISSMLAYTLLRGNPGAFIYSAGVAYDVFGMYFLFRCWIRSSEDIARIGVCLAALAIPSAFLFYQSARTGMNPFAIFGGISEHVIEREGRLRVQGPFVHPILAGCFWASLLPIVLGPVRASRGQAFLCIPAMLGIIGIVFFSASSTPIAVVAAVIAGYGMWIARNQMRGIRWALVVTLCGLHVVMQAPVWHLISRINAVGGSTGYHRYRLIDNAIRRFDEWALLGVKGTAHWGHYMFDVTNQYVKEGVRGGILSLALFVLMIGWGFAYAGRVRKSAGRDKTTRVMAWSLGVCLFAQSAMFFSVSITHAQQNMLAFFLVVASLASLEQARRYSSSPARMALKAIPHRPNRPKRLYRVATSE